MHAFIHIIESISEVGISLTPTWEASQGSQRFRNWSNVITFLLSHIINVPKGYWVIEFVVDGSFELTFTFKAPREARSLRTLRDQKIQNWLKKLNSSKILRTCVQQNCRIRSGKRILESIRQNFSWELMKNWHFWPLLGGP